FHSTQGTCDPHYLAGSLSKSRSFWIGAGQIYSTNSAQSTRCSYPPPPTFLHSPCYSSTGEWLANIRHLVPQMGYVLRARGGEKQPRRRHTKNAHVWSQNSHRKRDSCRRLRSN